MEETQRITAEELQRSHAWLFEATFLGHLDRSEQNAALARARVLEFEPNHVLIHEGQPNATVLLLLSGEAAVERGIERAAAAHTKSSVGHLIAGHLTGERSVRLGRPASATVTTLSRVRALAFSAGDFRHLLNTLPALRAYVDDIIELRDRSSDVRELISRQPILSALDPSDADRLLQWGRLIRLAPAELVLRVGELTDDAYLLVRGQVDVFLPGAGGERTYASTQGPGWFFGHAAVVLSGPRSADIVAKTATEVLRISAETLISFMERNPMFRRRINEDLAQTHLHLREAVVSAERPRVVALYGARAGLGTTSIAYGLAAALGSVTLVDTQGAIAARRLRVEVEDATLSPQSGVVDDRAGEVSGGIAVHRARLPVSGATLLEPRGHQAVVTIMWPAEPSQLPQMMTALRHSAPPRSLILCAAETQAEAGADAMALADAVVYVRGPADGLHEHATLRNQQRVDALRLQGGTSGEVNNVVRIPDDPGPIEAFWRSSDATALASTRHAFGRACRRLGRKLMGESFGLALGGGGALGFAHIGLIQALEAHGITIDVVSGSSFGALVAGLYAAGGLPALEQLVARRVSLMGTALGAFASTAGFQWFVDNIVGKRPMGSTEIPFLPVSLDIDTGEEVVLAHGTVGEGVRSSSGLPGVYPALKVGGRRLVDGGINNNVPASVAKRAGADFVLASNIIPTFPFESGDRLGVHRTPLLNRLDAGVRSLFFLMSQNGRDRSTQADFVFNAASRGYNVYSFAAGPAILEAARAQAEQLMPQILESYRTDASRLYRAVG